jgi:hypothetical protein
MSSLSGLKQIAAYIERSKNSTLMLIRKENFPAVKMLGTWESDTTLVEKWRIWFILKTHGATDEKLDLYKELLQVLNQPQYTTLQKNISVCK